MRKNPSAVGLPLIASGTGWRQKQLWKHLTTCYTHVAHAQHRACTDKKRQCASPPSPACSAAISVVDILGKQDLARVAAVRTTTVKVKDEGKRSAPRKAKIIITLQRLEKALTLKPPRRRHRPRKPAAPAQ